jgi:hypothetical protein
VAPWKEVASQVSVFQIYADILRRASDEDLMKLINYLGENKIALAIEIPVLADTAWCEPGKKRNRWMVPLLARLKRLGGDLRYVAMVGPLVDGHIYKKQFYCHLPIDDVAADAAKTINAMQQLFPNIIVGDIEPLAHNPEYPDWSEFPLWLEAFKREAKTPISFIHLDVRWALDWEGDLKQLAKIARDSGVSLGVIYHGDPTAQSSEAVARGLARHEDEVEQRAGVALDEVIFQSWLNYPDHVLPETDSTSMTGIVRDYLHSH